MHVLIGIAFLLLIALAILTFLAFAIVLMKRAPARHGSSGSLGSAMLDLQTLVDPGKKHVIEAQRELEEAEDEDDSGGPPEP